MKLIKEITFASIVSVLLMMPFGSVFSEDLLTDEFMGFNNIPTWGPTWCDNTITYRIDNISGLSLDIQAAMEKGVTEWADHAPTNGVSQITLEEAESGTTPDIILKYKKGGGRVQGHALQQNDGEGCFTQVKINVSGKAFGSDSSAAQVQSIAMQEVGHGLGLLHSDNKKDVMYGTVQSSPNVILSECDIEAWNLVMKWYVDGVAPYAPGSQTVPCGDAGSGSGGTSITATDAYVSYNSKGGRLGVTVQLLDETSSPSLVVPNTTVKIELSLNGFVVYEGTKTTNDNGDAKWNFVGAKKGTYTTKVLQVGGSDWENINTHDDTHTKEK